jgi:hypothetical protein
LPEIGQYIVSGAIGIVDPDRFAEAMQKARRNEDVPIASLNRTLTLESWLRHLTLQGVLTNSVPTKDKNTPRLWRLRNSSRALGVKV